MDSDIEVNLTMDNEGNLVVEFDGEVAAKWSKKDMQLVWVNPAYMGNWREAK